MRPIEAFFTILTDAIIQFFTAFVATCAAAVIFQFSAVVAVLTGAVCQLLVAVFASSACTGTARKGAAIANLIHWVHFLSHEGCCVGGYQGKP